ncbi:MAG: hypothetical protein LBJ69_03340 [Holosporales bacterium]|jgi:hypothetical protein|nr:hypothetical protein [Holosporales bacterium]
MVAVIRLEASLRKVESGCMISSGIISSAKSVSLGTAENENLESGLWKIESGYALSAKAAVDVNGE